MKRVRRRLPRWTSGLPFALLLLHRTSSFQLPTATPQTHQLISTSAILASPNFGPRAKISTSVVEKRSPLHHSGQNRCGTSGSSTTLHAVSRAASAAVAASSSSMLWSWIYMALLAIQYGMQPILVRKFAPRDISRSSFVFCHDVAKASMSLLLLALSGHGASCMAGWSVASWLRIAAAPAALYVIQMYCSVMAYQNLAPVTFNVLNQTKTLSAALWCYLLLGKAQSKLQIASLWVLSCAALVLEKIIPLPRVRSKQQSTAKNMATLIAGGSGRSDDKKKASSTAIAASVAAPTSDNAERNTHLMMGVLPVMFASLISGLAGALCQQGLQVDGRNTYMFTMEISLASIILLGLSMSLGVTPDSQQLQTRGFWYGWTPRTWIPVITQGLGGVFVGLVIKYSGNVRKGFALIFGLLLCGILQARLKNGSGDEETKLTREQVVGGILAAVSLWMHSAFPAVKR